MACNLWPVGGGPEKLTARVPAGRGRVTGAYRGPTANQKGVKFGVPPPSVFPAIGVPQTCQGPTFDSWS